MELIPKNLLNIVSALQYPSARNLKDLALHDLVFSKRTRHILTIGSQFEAAHIPIPDGTWAFSCLEKSFPSVEEACNILAKYTKKRVQCNAYLTPAGAQGLPTHYDLHDVLVLQIEGSKDWKIWKTFRKNVSAETLLYDETENLPAWTASSPSQELRLTNNNMLFLKAGEPHVAIATLEGSLHLSFGFYND